MHSLVVAQPLAGRVDVVEGPTPALPQVPHDGAKTAETAAPVVEVGGHGQETLARQPVGLGAKVWLIPVKSWITTTPGHGGGVAGTAQ